MYDLILQRVNNTSSLQIHSLMYRFHPSIRWQSGYPDRKQIISQVTELWKRYGLQERTKFQTKVTSVSKNDKGQWLINDDTHNGQFDGVICAIGTCGDPKIP